MRRMSARHKPAAAASNKRALQDFNDQHVLGGKDSFQSLSAWQESAPIPAWHSPTYQYSCDRGSAYNPPPDAGWGGGAHPAPSYPPSPSPVFNPGITPHLSEATERVEAGPGGGGGVRVGAGPVAAARCAPPAPTLVSPPAILYSVPSHYVPQVRPTRTHPAPLPQLEATGRRQPQ